MVRISKAPGFNRILYQRWEDKFLCENACRSSQTRGRLKFLPEDRYRNPFERDANRIRYSKPYRRLAGVTQVHPDPESPTVHTRIFHTEEVAQIARGLCRRLWLNADLAEAIALGHDLGHAPFGHAGEKALDDISKRERNNIRFVHNLQSLRVVDELFPLNLTYEVREGIVCHLGETNEIEIIPYGKLEREKERDLDLSFFKTGKIGKLEGREYVPSTLEGCVVRISDRIAAIPLDFEDAVDNKIVRRSQLPEKVQKILGKTTSEIVKSIIESIVEESWDSARKNVFRIKMNEIVGEALNEFYAFNMEKIYRSEEMLRRFVRLVPMRLETIYRYYVLYPTSGNKQPMSPTQAIDTIATMTDRFAEQEANRIIEETRIKPIV